MLRESEALSSIESSLDGDFENSIGIATRNRAGNESDFVTGIFLSSSKEKGRVRRTGELMICEEMEDFQILAPSSSLPISTSGAFLGGRHSGPL